jgi:hypothetical protein
MAGSFIGAGATVTGAGVTSLSVPVPSGNSGDLLYLQTSLSVASTPAGWTVVVAGQLYRKTATAASEGNVALATLDGDYFGGEDWTVYNSSARVTRWRGIDAAPLGSQIQLVAQTVDIVFTFTQLAAGRAVLVFFNTPWDSITPGTTCSGKYNGVAFEGSVALAGSTISKAGAAYTLSCAAGTSSNQLRLSANGDTYATIVWHNVPAGSSTYTHEGADAGVAQDAVADSIHQAVTTEVVTDVAVVKESETDTAPQHAGLVSYNVKAGNGVLEYATLPSGLQAGDVVIAIDPGVLMAGAFSGWSQATCSPTSGNGSYFQWRRYTGVGEERIYANVPSGQQLIQIALRGVPLTGTIVSGSTQRVGGVGASGSVAGFLVKSGAPLIAFLSDYKSSNVTLPPTPTGPVTTKIAEGIGSVGQYSWSLYLDFASATGVVGAESYSGTSSNLNLRYIGLVMAADSYSDAATDTSVAADAVADTFHDVNVSEVVADVAQAKEAPPADPERDHVPGPLSEVVTGAATAPGVVVTQAPAVQLDPLVGCYGGGDAYSGEVKGKFTSPTDGYIGRRRQLGKAVSPDARGDRALFFVPRAQVPKDGSGTVGRATLILTPVTVGTYDASDPVAGTLAKVQAAPASLNPNTCTLEDVLSAALSGDYGTFAMRALWSDGDPVVTRVGPGVTGSVGPVWLCGGRGYFTTLKARPQNPWEINLTSLVNARVAAGQDIAAVLDFSPSGRADTKVVAEFYGQAVPELRPRLEVDPFGASDLVFSDLDTCTPTLSVTTPAGATLKEIAWGYDSSCEQGYTTGVTKVDHFKDFSPYEFPMLETSARVFVKVTLDYGGPDRTVTFERSFFTPKSHRPKMLAKDSTGIGLSAARSLHPYISHPAGVSTLWAQLNSASSFTIWGHTSQPVTIDENTGARGYNFGQSAGRGSIGGDSWQDIGGCFTDWATAAHYTMLSNLRTADSRYNVVLYRTTGAFSYAWNIWDMIYIGPDFSVGTSADVGVGGLTFAAPLDGRLFATTRAEDWRKGAPSPSLTSMLVAFVGDGKLYVYSSRSYDAKGFALAGNIWTLEIGPTGSGAATVVDVNPDAEVAFLHGLTRDRQHRTILVARTSSGNCVLGSRTDDVITTASDGSAPTTTPGTWTTRSVPNFAQAYMGSPGIKLTGVADEPDFETASLVLVRPAAPHMEFLRIDSLNPGKPDGRSSTNLNTSHSSSEAVMCNPPPWGPYDAPNTISPNTQWYDGRLVDDWPACTQVIMRTAHGGAMGFDLSGGKLRAQRIYDRARLSEISSIDAPTGATTIRVISERAPEGAEVAVMVGGGAGAWAMFTVTAGMDISRIDAPTPDLKWRLTTGTLEAGTNVVLQQDSGLRGLTKLPGYNTFGATWQWDSWSAVPAGLMNHAGTAKVKVLGGKGQSVRLKITNTSLGGGAWIDGTFYPYGYEPHIGYTGSPELIGGLEFPMIRWQAWYISQDGGKTFDRCYATQWIPCGESPSNGEVIIQTPTLTGDEVWICKEAPNDYETWQLKVTEVLSRAANPLDTAYHKVKCVASNGDLLYLGSDPAKIGQPVSQVETDGVRKLVTWEPNLPGNATGVGCDNWKGMLIDWEFADGGKPRAEKSLIVCYGDDDASEQGPGRNLLFMIDFLLSGAVRARSLLKKFSFLFIPMSSQAGVKYGQARFALDGIGSGGSYDHVTPAQWVTGSQYRVWGGGSRIGEFVITAAQEEWRSSMPVERQADAVFCETSWHADTHNRDAATPLVPPFLVVGFPGFATPEAGVAAFNTRYLPTVWPEVHARQTGYSSPVTPGSTNFTLELPWNGPSPKLTFWGADDSAKNWAAAFLDGISIAGGAFDVYDETGEDASIASDVVKDQLIFTEAPAGAAKGPATATDQAIGRETPAERVVAPDSSVAQMQAAEVAAQAAQSREQASAGLSLTDVTAGGAQAGDVAEAHPAYTEAPAGGAQTGDSTGASRVAPEAPSGAGQAPGAVTGALTGVAAPSGAAQAPGTVLDSLSGTPQPSVVTEALSGAGQATGVVVDTQLRDGQTVVGAFPALPGLSIALTRIPLYKTYVGTSVTGHETRHARQGSPRYRYSLEMEMLRKNLTVDEAQQLADFIMAQLGRYGRFTFFDPYDNQPRTCRFDTDETTFERLVSDIWQVRALDIITVK